MLAVGAARTTRNAWCLARELALSETWAWAATARAALLLREPASVATAHGRYHSRHLLHARHHAHWATTTAAATTSHRLLGSLLELLHVGWVVGAWREGTRGHVGHHAIHLRRNLLAWATTALLGHATGEATAALALRTTWEACHSGHAATGIRWEEGRGLAWEEHLGLHEGLMKFVRTDHGRTNTED